MDITERKELERRLERSNVDLQQFAYVASHDLQEPLRTINNFLELLEVRYHDKLDAKAHEYIDYARQGGDRLRLLIDDLLEYSRVDAVSKFGPVDMNEVVLKSLAILEMQIKENDAEIEVESLPTIQADESQMIQLMQNLIGNAIKFHGLERPRIHISASEGARAVTFAVEDNGIGIDMQYADSIFQMFHRLNNREEFPGTGVGLAISKKIIDHHGGTIWVESQQGVGSTFRFSIPV
jgi:light-regulated signal transduction histidine kinase (bacteriophytochrome)